MQKLKSGIGGTAPGDVQTGSKSFPFLLSSTGWRSIYRRVAFTGSVITDCLPPLCAETAAAGILLCNYTARTRVAAGRQVARYLERRTWAKPPR